jgi:nitroreductase
VGTDLVQFAADPDPFRSYARGQRDAATRVEQRQYCQDHGSAGNGDHRSRHPLLRLLRTFPHNQTAITWFNGEGREAVAQTTAFPNGSLQGAYFIVAARSLGLDCGAMSGFDDAKVDAAFFPDGRFKSNFLCNIGYGDHSKLFDRSPRLPFEDVCSFA